MIVSIVKVIGVAFASLMAYSTFLNYKRKDFSKPQFYFWELVWAFLLFTVFFTSFMTKAVEFIGFIRVMDFLTVAGFIVVILLSFHNYSSLNKLKKSLEENVRDEALKDIKK
jgi:hypothetical protein